MAVSWIVFHLTDRCQLACRHCLRDPGRNPYDLPLSLVEQVLDQAVSVYRSAHVGLTGGEPTLHPQLDCILDAIVSRSLSWHLVTNAASFDRLLAVLQQDPRRRDGLTAIDFSLDGAREQTHDSIRGEGSYRQVMSAVATAQALQLPFIIQMTVNSRNVDEIEELGLLASQLGAKRVAFGPLQATGTPADAELRLSLPALRQAHDRVLRLGETLRIPVCDNEGFPRPQPFHCCEPFRSEILHVDVLGRLSLCCSLSGVPGGDGAEVMADLRRTSLTEAHARLLTAVSTLQQERLQVLAHGQAQSWDLLPCNWCMRRHGKPYWTEQGSAGPRAARRRRPDHGQS